MVDYTFLSENGITSSSANDTCNRAKEWYEPFERELRKMSFYDTRVAVIGTDKLNTATIGWTEERFKSIKEKAENIIRAKKLIAYLREAIKAKDEIDNYLSSLTFEEWAEIMGVTIPAKPMPKSPKTRYDILANMTVKERSLIFELEAEAACYGQLIHPHGALSNARDELYAKTQEPCYVHGDGRDTIIYTYEPTVDIDDIEELFFELNQAHRAVQKRLNGINGKIDKEIDEDKLRINNEFMKENAEYNLVIRDLKAKFIAYVDEERVKLRRLGIIIPNHLKDTYDFVNSLGKKKE